MEISINQIQQIKRDLQKVNTLTDFEALKIAVEIQKNEFFKRANAISESDSDSNPTALENIAMQLEILNSK
jgi:hypothetical protein